MTRHVTLLGVSGFVGSALLREFTTHPLRLRAVARTGSRDQPPGSAGIEHLRVDLLEPGRVAQVVADTDVVVHLVAYAAGGSTWRSAATVPEAERVNAGIMRDLVAALRARPGPAPVLLFASTTQAANPAAPSRYAQHKIEAERILRQATEDGVVDGVILRLPAIYGHSGPSGQTGRGVVTAMIRRALAGEPITMWHEGSVRRNLLHVEDVATAFTAALHNHEALVGDVWTPSADEARPLGEIFETVAASVARQTGNPAVPVVSVPPPENAEANDFRSDDFDSTEFRTLTGWHPRVPLAEGIDRTVAALISTKE
uniref:TDP-4-keto-6-deoxyhexose 4-ketoreductase n=1 Tax=Micromonospora megalomicea subsp. nigra TaxID=136926 RepID=Q9F831_MICMH|nr:TDP-4-keto-6-deoxyhexose 4-ketoreductase [Micromonospora megalomicea subsp. nigra]